MLKPGAHDFWQQESSSNTIVKMGLLQVRGWEGAIMSTFSAEEADWQRTGRNGKPGYGPLVSITEVFTARLSL